MALPKPISRSDMYLSYLNDVKGLNLDDLPTPGSRSDMYLYNLCVNRDSSEGSNVTLNGNPQTEFDFISDENHTVKEIKATNSQNQPIILQFATDSDRVEDKACRTQEQINRTFYKRACKEIPSPNGEPVTVNNGEEGYVLSSEIKGNTQLFKRAKGSQGEWIAIPNDEARDIEFEYKLDSTQAIILNNSQQYPIYASEEDKANKKVVSLGGVGNVQDTLEIKEDGSGVCSKKRIKFNLVDLTFAFDNATLPNTLRYVAEIGDLAIKDASNGLCSNFEVLTANALESDTQNICVVGTKLFVRVLKSNLTNESLSGFNKYLQETQPVADLELATPIITDIPKELVPAILTHKANVWKVGGKVKASSYKIVQPVDRLAEFEARLQALESNTVVLNK